MPNPSTSGDFALKVNGQLYDGWKSIEVTRSIDAMASSFEILVTDRWPGHPDQWPVKTGDAVVVTIDGELVMTGWVDEVEPEENDEKHEVKLKGRGRTGDLVDCSAMNAPGRWTSRRIDQIVKDLVSPFKIAVTLQGDGGAPFKAFAIQQGESVKDAIDRLVQQRGLLPMETPSGDLTLASPSQTRSAGSLVLGGNVTEAKGKHSALQRFSKYVVKGQRQGHDHDNGTAVTRVSGTVTDPQVTRYRPLMIMAEDQADGLSAQTRAKFAATVRAGRAQTGSLTVTGVRDAGGKLWAPNVIVPVTAPNEGLMGDLLINEVKLKSDDKGGMAEVHVTRPEAYSLGEVKGVGLSRLDSRGAGRGQKIKGRKGRSGQDISVLADLPS